MVDVLPQCILQFLNVLHTSIRHEATKQYDTNKVLPKPKPNNKGHIYNHCTMPMIPSKT